MSTSKSQRIGIWVIAVVLTIGTIGSFFVIILANSNSAQDQQLAQKQQDECNKQITAYQNQANAQADKLSDKYYSVLKKYAGEVGSFDAANIKKLSTKDLKTGTGAKIDANTSYDAYYIGWNPDGKIFDQSIDSKKLKAPIPGSGLIQGWMDGVKGMKIGGVRELTIPSDQAYGSRGGGDLIPPNTPIKFIVLAIPTPATISIPPCAQQEAEAQAQQQ